MKATLNGRPKEEKIFLYVERHEGFISKIFAIFYNLNLNNPVPKQNLLSKDRVLMIQIC